MSAMAGATEEGRTDPHSVFTGAPAGGEEGLWRCPPMSCEAQTLCSAPALPTSSGPSSRVAGDPGGDLADQLPRPPSLTGDHPEGERARPS